MSLKCADEGIPSITTEFGVQGIHRVLIQGSRVIGMVDMPCILNACIGYCILHFLKISILYQILQISL